MTAVKRSASDIIEHSVSPWLRLITPIALALIMFILNNLNSNISSVAEDVSTVKDKISVNGERIKATETAIDIYHNN